MGGFTWPQWFKGSALRVTVDKLVSGIFLCDFSSRRGLTLMGISHAATSPKHSVGVTLQGPAASAIPPLSSFTQHSARGQGFHPDDSEQALVGMLLWSGQSRRGRTWQSNPGVALGSSQGFRGRPHCKRLPSLRTELSERQGGLAWGAGCQGLREGGLLASVC